MIDLIVVPQTKQWQKRPRRSATGTRIHMAAERGAALRSFAQKK